MAAKTSAPIAPSSYTALTVSSRTAKVTHLWVGTGNLCGAEFTLAPVVRQLQKNSICTKCAALQDVFDVAQEAAEADRERIMQTDRARRLTDGQSAVTGWELLYDKPSKNAQIGRADGKYALICTTHKHARRLEKLADDRALLKGGAWCPQCVEADELVAEVLEG